MAPASDSSLELASIQDAERTLGATLTEKFGGRWVAVRDHEVIASAPAADALYDMLPTDEARAIRSFLVLPRQR